MDKVLTALAELYSTAKRASGSILCDVKSIYEGEPTKLPESDCPALIIQPGGTGYRHDKSGSQYDVRDARVKVTLVLSRKQFYASNYGDDGDAKKIFVEAKAAQMIEGTDDSQHADVNSVVGVVQNNQRLPYSGGEASSMALVEQVEYDVTPPRARGFDSYEVTVESIVTLRGNRA